MSAIIKTYLFAVAIVVVVLVVIVAVVVVPVRSDGSVNIDGPSWTIKGPAGPEPSLEDTSNGLTGPSTLMDRVGPSDLPSAAGQWSLPCPSSSGSELPCFTIDHMEKVSSSEKDEFVVALQREIEITSSSPELPALSLPTRKCCRIEREPTSPSRTAR